MSCLTDDQRDSITGGDICQIDVDGHLDQIQTLLPQGHAWSRDPDSTLGRYWRSFAEVIKFLEDRICDLHSEFFCLTANETLGVWAETYGVDAPDAIDQSNPCLKPEYTVPPLSESQVSLFSPDLCGRVAAQGGSTCAYFEESARSIGFVVECDDCELDADYAIAGCFISGCSQLGPRPEMDIEGGNQTYNTLNNCDYQKAVDHPDPRFWNRAFDQSLATCPIPGSTLGPETCCFVAGDFSSVNEVENQLSQSCGEVNAPVNFDECINLDPYTGPKCTSGITAFAEYLGHRGTLVFNIQGTETAALLSDLSPCDPFFIEAGHFYAGDECNPVRNIDITRLENLMESIVPAHINIVINLDGERT